MKFYFLLFSIQENIIINILCTVLPFSTSGCWLFCLLTSSKMAREKQKPQPQVARKSTGGKANPIQAIHVKLAAKAAKKSAVPSTSGVKKKPHRYR